MMGASQAARNHLYAPADQKADPLALLVHPFSGDIGRSCNGSATGTTANSIQIG